MTKKVLVTGGQGQLARSLKSLCLKQQNGHEFVFTRKEELDITDYDQVLRFFEDNKFDYCINCAAYTNVEQSESTPELAQSVNTFAVGNLAETCKKLDVVLIHISTDYVFDGTQDHPYKEEDATNPINQYGLSKLKGELIIRETMKKYFIVRTSWLYSKYEGNFVSTIVKKIKSNNDLVITTSQVGTPTSCLELSGFLLFLIENRSQQFGVYHFSSTGQTTWYGLALEIASYFKNYNSLKIKPTDYFKTKAQRPAYSVLSNEKAIKLINNRSNWKFQLRQVLKDLI